MSKPPPGKPEARPEPARDPAAPGLPVRLSDLRGCGLLAEDATLAVADLVEAYQRDLWQVAGRWGGFSSAPAEAALGVVFGAIRTVARLAGDGTAALLGGVEGLAPVGGTSAAREAVLAALNGVFGEHLAARRNPLAIPLAHRQGGLVLDPEPGPLAAAFPEASGRILLLVHGLCMNDLQWRRHGHEHGAALAAAAGYSPVHLHYNSGLHVSANGRAWADQLERLLEAWPVPVREVCILAHSMGGLVARSACHYGAAAGHRWPHHLGRVVFLGTPHHGAPLERGGHWLELLLGASPATAALARLGRARSAGIMDLRYGCLVDEDWAGREGRTGTRDRRRPVPLPAGVRCFAIGATLAARGELPGAGPLGDGLVPLDSALGRHPELDLGLPAARTWIARGMGHLDLLDRPEVYAKIREWLA